MVKASAKTIIPQLLHPSDILASFGWGVINHDVYISSSGIDYLVNHFINDPKQLQNEIKCAESHIANMPGYIADGWVSEEYGEIWADWWRDYAEACEIALELIHSCKPFPKTNHKTTPRIDVDALKNSLDIVEVIGRYTTLNKRGANFTGLCPLHPDKRTPSLSVNPKKQSWHCFGVCDTGGDVISFVEKAENCDFKQAVSLLSR